MAVVGIRRSVRRVGTHSPRFVAQRTQIIHRMSEWLTSRCPTVGHVQRLWLRVPERAAIRTPGFAGSLLQKQSEKSAGARGVAWQKLQHRPRNSGIGATGSFSDHPDHSKRGAAARFEGGIGNRSEFETNPSLTICLSSGEALPSVATLAFSICRARFAAHFQTIDS
jgi:hypothetical protein